MSISKPTKKVDYLDEDEVLSSQAYFLFSYFTTGDPEMPVVMKVRGFRKSIMEAEKFAKKLTEKDPYHNVYVCDTGKWGGLFTKAKFEELQKENPDIQEIYTDEKLQNIMKTFKENSDEAREQAEKRKKLMSQTSDGRKTEINELKRVNKDLEQNNISLKKKLAKLEDEQDVDLKKVVKAKLEEEMSNNRFHIQNNNTKIEEFQKQLSFSKYVE